MGNRLPFNMFFRNTVLKRCHCILILRNFKMIDKVFKLSFERNESTKSQFKTDLGHSVYVGCLSPPQFRSINASNPFALYWRKPQLFVAHGTAFGVTTELIIAGFSANPCRIISYIRFGGAINWWPETCAFHEQVFIRTFSDVWSRYRTKMFKNFEV